MPQALFALQERADAMAAYAPRTLALSDTELQCTCHNHRL